MSWVDDSKYISRGGGGFLNGWGDLFVDWKWQGEDRVKIPGGPYWQWREAQAAKAAAEAAKANQSSQLSGRQSTDTRATAERAAVMADPFAAQRPQYQGKLAALMQNPGEFASSPAYQFAFDQGMEAVNRTAAAKGELGSGKRLTDLMRFGQGLASQQYFPQANLLSNLAGVNAGSPGGAGQMLMQGVKDSQGQETASLGEKLYADAQAKKIADAEAAARQQAGAAAGGYAQQLGGVNGIRTLIPGSYPTYNRDGSIQSPSIWR